MKNSLQKLGLLLIAGLKLQGDGFFEFAKLGPLVTVGYENGPIAGSSILAQVLAGPAPDDLSRIGDPIQFTGGRIFSRIMDVPFMNQGETVFVKLAAWDSSIWGFSYSNVPLKGVVTSSTYSTDLRIQSSQTFTVLDFPERLVVPSSVPEPSMVALLVSGLAMIAALRVRSKCS